MEYIEEERESLESGWSSKSNESMCHGLLREQCIIEHRALCNNHPCGMDLATCDVAHGPCAMSHVVRSME